MAFSAPFLSARAINSPSSCDYISKKYQESENNEIDRLNYTEDIKVKFVFTLVWRLSGNNPIS